MLPSEIADQLQAIDVDPHDSDSSSSARAAFGTLVPAVEDALVSFDYEPSPLRPSSPEQLLTSRKVDTASEENLRALLTFETDPPVAITASRVSREPLLQVYIEDRPEAFRGSDRGEEQKFRCAPCCEPARTRKRGWSTT